MSLRKEIHAALLAVSVVFPGADWEKIEPIKAGWNSAALNRVEEYAFAEGEKGSSFQTDSFLIITGGKIVSERYARDYTPSMRHYGWSMAKSVNMALLGVAVREKVLSLDDLVTRWIPETKGGGWDGVKLEHLLSMSSGRNWNEGYEGSPFTSNIVAGLYRNEPSENIGLYAVRVGKKLAEPGTRLNYSSGDTNLLMLCLNRALGKNYETFPWEHFFDRVGMKSAVFERDRSGNIIGSSYIHATPRDFARLGYLFLRGGKWGDLEILSPEFVKLANTTSPALPVKGAYHTTEEVYGHGWWMNRAIPERGIESAMPGVPPDSYMAQGHYGQILLVIPAWDTLVLRLGNDSRGKSFDLKKMAELLKAARLP